MKASILLRILVVTCVISTFRVEAQLLTLDQSFTSPHNEGANINEGFTYVAQTFTAGASGNLAAVSVDISGYNDTMLPLHIQILGVSGGVPDSSELGDTVLSSSSSVLSQMILFPQAIPVTSGLEYAIVASYVGAPPAGAGQVQGIWGGAGGTTDYYPGGGLYVSDDLQLWSALSFQNSFFDQHFQTWVTPVPEPHAWVLVMGALLGVALITKSRNHSKAR